MTNQEASINRVDGNIVIVGAVTIDNVVALTQKGITLLGNSAVRIDLEKISEMDSTIISMLLEWLRTARKQNVSLQYINLPESLRGLIQLYGVTEIIPVALHP